MKPVLFTGQVSGVQVSRGLLIAVAFGAAAWAFSQTPGDVDYTKLDIQDLMKVEVTTASKDAQSISNVPSAIYVITADDIRRAGAQTVPDALRLAPGVIVEQVDENRWRVSIRGFASETTDKVLVMIDGRSVVNPAFMGVAWDSATVPIAEIDRIEVIRGPDGSRWGVDAVNGVINIITKNAKETLGGLATGYAGSDFRDGGYVHYGTKTASDGALRFYAQGYDRNAFETGPQAPKDGWETAEGGVRYDQDGRNDEYMLKIDYLHERLGTQGLFPAVNPELSTPFVGQYPTTEANLTSQWEHHGNDGASSTAQFYAEYSDRRSEELDETLNIYSFDYQTRLAPIGSNSITLGLGWRHSWDKTGASEIHLSPPSDTADLISSFLQDSVTLHRNLKLMFGSQFELNGPDGFESQPNAQLLYTPSSNRSYWLSVSKAVTTPAGIPNATGPLRMYPGTPMMELFLVPGDYGPEQVLAYEAGTRFNLNEQTYVDLTAFYDHYLDARTLEYGQPIVEMSPSGPYALVPVTFGNKLSGNTAGLEAVLKWKPTSWWDLDASASLFGEKMTFSPTSTDPQGYGADGVGEAPRQMAQIQSKLNLAHSVQFDTDIYYVSGLVNGLIPSHTQVDLRLGWSPVKTLDVDCGVHNLVSNNHLEASESIYETIQGVPRSWYLRATYKF
jgi:iron complex outermembrane receptor protein